MDFILQLPTRSKEIPIEKSVSALDIKADIVAGVNYLGSNYQRLNVLIVNSEGGATTRMLCLLA